MQSSSINSRLFGITALLICFVLIVLILILAKSFLIPLAWSLLIALASFRMLNKIENRYRINRMISSLVYVILILLIILMLFYFFYIEIVSIIKGIPDFSILLIESIQQTILLLEDYGIHLPLIDQNQIHIWISNHSETISNVLKSLGKSFGEIFLVGLYLFFILYYRDNYLYYLKLKTKGIETFSVKKKQVTEISDVISNFLFGLFSITFILTILLLVLFLAIGLKYALFFALLVSLLTLIPYIGNPIGMIIVVIFAIISSDDLTLPALALGSILVGNALKSYVFKPIIIGNKINLNAFVIFLSVILGGLIWGISGMILFMPFAGILKVMMQYNDRTKPLVALFVSIPKDIINSENDPESAK
ncbi:AI-2E family transporter [Algoriphagus halophilus]|uniref:Predicted PurR-regulated permease PerM n=1 Tax=Algoriphagus halophilus TaxID=226505 RepID=A0A1N6DUW1_9BACT|nr:AI-2E family transporter [Algoriphagus halophilus]SIN74497.1 Predicted PurR-regulated permease PerM [Algoriphagus halophilus]